MQLIDPEGTQEDVDAFITRMVRPNTSKYEVPNQRYYAWAV